uniref:F-box protein AT5G49610-like beta-propeller domain-containing protein n=1 Tax=Aegilops tauschii subsp. strangulata TaxID=200361 RepID=A0A453MZ52_AEGTS
HFHSSSSSTAMASELGLAPPAKRPLAAAPTTITGIGDDLLRGIFLLLPSLPSLVRAALACRTFLGAVRSSPAFRGRFLALHPPQLLGFFICPSRIASHPFVPSRGRSDPDLAAAVRGADFFLTRLPEDGGSSRGWHFETCYGGYAVLLNQTTDQVAAYNPLTQALHLFPQPAADKILFRGLPEYYFFSEEDQGVLRMVCVQHRNTSWQVPARIAVYSPATSSEWQILPWVETPPPLQPEEDGQKVITFYPGTQVKGFVYWKHTSQAYVLILNTATLQFSRVDLPPFFEEIETVQFMLGQTKDGELCMVGADDNDGKTGMLVVCVWRADEHGVEKWMLEHTFALSIFIDATEDDSTVQVDAIIDGYVYLSTKYSGQAESLLSFCLETAKLTKLFDGTYTSPSHPYIMAWPSSLVDNKVYRRMVKAKSSGRGGGDPEFSYQEFRTHKAARASSTGGLLSITEEDVSEDEQNELTDIERQ